MSSGIRKNFYTDAVESILTVNIRSRPKTCSAQDQKGDRNSCTTSALLLLQDIDKHCRTEAIKIIEDSTHPSNSVFNLLISGMNFHSLKAKTETREGFLTETYL